MMWIILRHKCATGRIWTIVGNRCKSLTIRPIQRFVLLKAVYYYITPIVCESIRFTSAQPDECEKSLKIVGYPTIRPVQICHLWVTWFNYLTILDKWFTYLRFPRSYATISKLSLCIVGHSLITPYNLKCRVKRRMAKQMAKKRPPAGKK